jgi:hypothetical protein
MRAGAASWRPGSRACRERELYQQRLRLVSLRHQTRKKQEYDQVDQNRERSQQRVFALPPRDARQLPSLVGDCSAHLTPTDIISLLGVRQ